MKWEHRREDDLYFVVFTDDKNVERIHPIAFTTVGEARRAAARLNEQYGIQPNPG